MKLKTKLGILLISISSVMLYVGCSSSDSSTSVSEENGSSSDSSTSVSEENGSSTQEGNGIFIDPRDGQSYKTVVIGYQEWMAENLNYETVGSYCYDDAPTNCETYGRLYDWEAANYACPEGWHLPTTEEFETLISNVGGQEVAGKMLKSTTLWDEDDNGIDAFGFNGLPAGYRRNGSYFYYAGMFANFWIATENGEDIAYYLALSCLERADLFYDAKFLAYSVRCLRGSKENGSSSDSSTSVSEENGASTQEGNGIFIDPRDGQSYKTVVIGNQEWMAENLNYETVGSYCYEAAPTNCETYGRLYEWSAALNACPSGWHLPTEEEFETLISNVGGSDVAGLMLKSTAYWNIGDYNKGYDAFGFNGLPAGYRYGLDNFGYAGECAGFWSATDDGEDYAYYLFLYHGSESAYLNNSSKDYAFSVRCLRD